MEIIFNFCQLDCGNYGYCVEGMLFNYIFKVLKFILWMFYCFFYYFNYCVNFFWGLDLLVFLEFLLLKVKLNLQEEFLVFKQVYVDVMMVGWVYSVIFISLLDCLLWRFCLMELVVICVVVIFNRLKIVVWLLFMELILWIC